MLSSNPPTDPIPAVLAGRSASLKAAGLSESHWRLLLLVALPYWAAFSILRIVSSELFASGGNLAFVPGMLGLTPEVRILHHVLMSFVVLGAYRLALGVGWPDERRWLAALKHASLALGVALISRPIFALAVDLLLWNIHWPGVFLPHSRGAKLWASMGLEFLLPYLFGLAIIAGVHMTTALQRSELDRATLRNAWTQARLQALRIQLNPHFLFNTFNTIATLLDATPQPARARSLMLALSDLYRRTLVAAEREWMPLEEELALAGDYLRIQAARFDGRLTYEIKCDPDLAREQVPALLLQPLVENAVVHGVADDRQPLSVWIETEVCESASGEPAMRIEVDNATPGALGSSPGAGIGLRNTTSRLSACYGSRARVDARATGTGRFIVSISIPRSVAETP